MHAVLVRLSDILHSTGTNNPYKDLVTRKTGRDIRGHLEERLMSSAEPCVFFLSMENVGIIDYSCADEIIAKMASALRSGSYGDRYFVIESLTTTHMENIDAALSRRKLSALCHRGENRWDIAGNLNSYLMETLTFVMNKGTCTVKEMAEHFQIELNTSGTRLLNLYKRRLVFRQIEESKKGAGRFVYKNLLLFRPSAIIQD